MNYDEMPVGREMDALIAEKVMDSVPCNAWEIHNSRSWVLADSCGHKSCFPKESGPPCYSTLISAAWEVVEKMVSNGYQFVVNGGKHDYSWGAKRHAGFNNDNETYHDGFADEVPLAICRAALRAVGVK